MTRRDGLLDGMDVDPFIRGKDQVEAAQIAQANNRAPAKPVPESTEQPFDATAPRFGPLAAIVEKFGRAQ